ncbi:N-acyl homoserine lactonase family protein [Enterovirga sp. DB1703]|uniref:N-acyl homoserine lactonase family protein n=2 Tax=Enterovirga aerilata TaxID=2730920 RepID=A0A849I2V8_9HYPH|nr:N-acyl homoserine lactonase family protein [Enterovirga sp. DB1703]NNM74136.1 N-acyl homoserine lactonase family protein [Enterovirga sp. DB1703]
MVPWAHAVIKEPVHAWLVTDGATKILVDSGGPGPAEMKRRLSVDAVGGGTETLVERLAAVGTRPDEIGTVILTHLHFDHAWNLELFPGAQLVVQRDEVFHAVDPTPTQRIYYLRETLSAVLGRKRPSGLRLVDGDVELMPGIELVKAPGHTPGMQAVVVTTERGRVALVSDCGDSYANWYPANPNAAARPMRYMGEDFLPGTIRSESERVYADSMRRILQRADIVVPAHDERIPKSIPEEWFAVPAAPPPG